MSNPYASFRPEAASTEAAERFFELLKSFGMPAAAAGRTADWSALAAPLAGQFEQWLRMSQSAGPWFGATPTGAAGGAGFAAAAPAWSFGPLPLGPGAVQGTDAQRTLELLGRLAQLQGQLAAHWSAVAQTATRTFIARMGSSAGPATPDQALRFYELWVECAEEAYAATVRSDDFCRVQAELANTSAALLVEQRRHAETLVRAFGLPTRNEMDALYGQLKELRAQLAQVAPGPRAPDAASARRPARQSRKAGGAPKRKPAARQRTRRPRA